MRSVKNIIGDYTGKYFEGRFFRAALNDLDSLEGSPEIVSGDFFCSNNELRSLKGAPKIVGGDFWCVNNDKLESLEGAPESVRGSFACSPKLLYGENLYIIANALLNGRKSHLDFEHLAIRTLINHFI